jgi:hypothetical protein
LSDFHWRFAGPPLERQTERRRVGVAEQKGDLGKAEVGFAHIFQGELLADLIEHIVEAGSERCELPRQCLLADPPDPRHANRPPKNFLPPWWRGLIRDAELFLSVWGNQAANLGWTTLDPSSTV